MKYDISRSHNISNYPVMKDALFLLTEIPYLQSLKYECYV